MLGGVTLDICEITLPPRDRLLQDLALLSTLEGPIVDQVMVDHRARSEVDGCALACANLVLLQNKVSLFDNELPED
jgi:hypothetical protein